MISKRIMAVRDRESRRLETISSLWKKNFVAKMLHEVDQPHHQKLYFENSKFETKCLLNVAEVAEKTVQANKFTLKTPTLIDWD